MSLLISVCGCELDGGYALAFRRTPGVVGDIQCLFWLCPLLIRVTSVRPCSLRLFVESFRPEGRPKMSDVNLLFGI